MKSIKQPDQIIQNPNKRGRPKGSPNKRTAIRLALSAIYSEKGITGERGFWLAVAQQAKDGCTTSAAMLADRLYPKLKPESQTITLPEPLTGTTANMARQLVQFAGNGDIPTSAATELLSALANVVRIEEITELTARIEALEQGQDE